MLGWCNIAQYINLTTYNFSVYRVWPFFNGHHHSDVIIGAMASQISSLTIVLHNRLFRSRSKKVPKLRVTGVCAGNSPVTGEFPAQMTSNAENVSIWWCHHVKKRNRHWLVKSEIKHVSGSVHLLRALIGESPWGQVRKIVSGWLHNHCIYIYIYIYMCVCSWVKFYNFQLYNAHHHPHHPHHQPPHQLHQPCAARPHTLVGEV